jgi:3-oxoacyl-[acyl-carrier protein] reductase
MCCYTTIPNHRCRFADAIWGLTALGHYGHPDDIASAVAYLGSPEAGFITGISWNVDGGFAA